MKCLILSFVAFTMLSSSVVWGQPAEDKLTRDSVMREFERNSPAVGERLPDLRAYNAAGEEIQLGDLKGNYTVLVFGCLT